MFGSLLRDFEEDPFFRDPFSAHREHVRHMMRSFSEPFGRDPFLSITDGREGGRGQRGPYGSQVALREDHRDMSLMDPFGAVDSMFSDVRNRMLNVHQHFDSMSASPSAHSFTSSAVMTYSKVGDGPAKVFQASSQTHSAPGGIKETRRALRDSERGIEKMAVGHHIKDRAHIVERSQNRKTGDHEEKQDFINLDESEAQTFDEEWQREISNVMPSGGRLHLGAAKHKNPRHAAVLSSEDAARRERNHPKAPADSSRKPGFSVEDINVKGTPMKTNKK